MFWVCTVVPTLCPDLNYSTHCSFYSAQTKDLTPADYYYYMLSVPITSILYAVKARPSWSVAWFLFPRHKTMCTWWYLYKPCAMCLSGLHFQPCAGSEPDCNCCCCLSNKYTYMQLRSPEVTRVNFHLSCTISWFWWKCTLNNYIKMCVAVENLFFCELWRWFIHRLFSSLLHRSGLGNRSERLNIVRPVWRVQASE